MDRLLSAAEAERLLGIKASTVRAWKTRRVLLPMGMDSHRRPLYLESHLVALRDSAGLRQIRRSKP